MESIHVWERVNDYLVSGIMDLLKADSEDENTKQRVRYSLLVICGEAQKFILLCIVFMCLRRVPEFLVSLVSLVSVRMFCGGSHRETALGCFIQSLCTFVAVMFLQDRIVIGRGIDCIIYLVLVCVIWFLGPIPSPRRISYLESQKQRFRGMALTVILLVQTIHPYISGKYYNVILWSWIVLTVEMTVTHTIRKRKEKRNDGK